MLGDRFAYVETPNFALRRLQLRHGNKDSETFNLAVYHTIFKSSKQCNYHWKGYENFDWSIDANAEVLHLEATSPPQLRALIRSLHAMARQSNDAAALLARILMDAMFSSTEFRRNALQRLVDNRNYYKEQPQDSQVMWATVYPWIAGYVYGPNTIVYEADHSSRSADIPYLALLLGRGYKLGQTVRARRPERAHEPTGTAAAQ